MSDPYRAPDTALAEPAPPAPDDGIVTADVGSDIDDDELAPHANLLAERGFAYLTDSVLAWVLGMVGGFLASRVAPGVGWAIPVGVYAGALLPPLVEVAFHASPGKMLVGLTVRRPSGRPVIWWRLLVRNILKVRTTVWSPRAGRSLAGTPTRALAPPQPACGLETGSCGASRSPIGSTWAS